MHFQDGFTLLDFCFGALAFETVHLCFVIALTSDSLIAGADLLHGTCYNHLNPEWKILVL